MDLDIPDEWQEIDGALERTFQLRDFAEAIAFVNSVAGAAEEANHHPDVAISWNLVTLRWRTHSAGAITKLDVAGARRSDELAP